MTVAKGDSHQTNPWAVCAHWLRGQTLVCDIRRKHEYSRWALYQKQAKDSWWKNQLGNVQGETSAPQLENKEN